MNTTLQDAIERTLEYSAQCTNAARLAGRLFADIAFSDKANFNLFGGSIWVTTTDRSDVEKVLAVAEPGQLWAKTAQDHELVYTITVAGIPVCLRVTAEALPPTCQLVEVDVEVPAKAAYVAKRRVLKCAGVTPLAPEDHPAGVEALSLQREDENARAEASDPDEV